MDLLDIFQSALRFALGPEVAIYVLAAVGLNLHIGHTGLTNFGLAGYMLVGAYGTAIGVTWFGMSLWGGVVLALLGSLALSLLLGLPTLRLGTIYLGMSTLAFAEVLRLLVRSDTFEPVTGGVFGLTNFASGFYKSNPLAIRDYGFAGIYWLDNQMWVMIVAWSCALLALLVVWLFMRSPWGRVLISIREDEQVPRSLGKRVYLRKVQSLVFGGLIMTSAGCLLAILQQSTSPDVFVPDLTFFIYLGLVLGGIGRTFGPLFGTIVFWFILTFVDGMLRSSEVVSEALGSIQIGSVRFIISGIALMAVIVLWPKGIVRPGVGIDRLIRASRRKKSVA